MRDGNHLSPSTTVQIVEVAMCVISFCIRKHLVKIENRQKWIHTLHNGPFDEKAPVESNFF